MMRSFRMEQLILPGVPGSLQTLEGFTSRLAETAGLDARRTQKLQLAVEELATNIINHGYAEHGMSGDITIQAEITPETLTIRVEDTSVPFNPRTCPLPKYLDKPIEERPVGGLGIYLLLKSVDRHAYAYIDGKNRNELIFDLRKQVVPAP